MFKKKTNKQSKLSVTNCFFTEAGTKRTKLLTHLNEGVTATPLEKARAGVSTQFNCLNLKRST